MAGFSIGRGMGPVEIVTKITVTGIIIFGQLVILEMLKTMWVAAQPIAEAALLEKRYTWDTFAGPLAITFFGLVKKVTASITAYTCTAALVAASSVTGFLSIGCIIPAALYAVSSLGQSALVTYGTAEGWVSVADSSSIDKRDLVTSADVFAKDFGNHTLFAWNDSSLVAINSTGTITSLNGTSEWTYQGSHAWISKDVVEEHTTAKIASICHGQNDINIASLASVEITILQRADGKRSAIIGGARSSASVASSIIQNGHDGSLSKRYDSVDYVAVEDWGLNTEEVASWDFELTTPTGYEEGAVMQDEMNYLVDEYGRYSWDSMCFGVGTSTSRTVDSMWVGEFYVNQYGGIDSDCWQG